MAINMAMVGTGRMLELISQDLHLVPGMKPKVIVSRTETKAKWAADSYGFAEYSDNYSLILERDDIDLIYVATPHSEHYALAMQAIDAGKHVLVEKAMTTNGAQTTKLLDSARTKNLFAMEAMWMAFNPAIIQARKWVEDEILGENLRLNANFCMAPQYLPNSRLWAKELAGGSTLDQGVYTISLAHMLFGVPTQITAQGLVRHGVDAEVVTQMEFEKGHRALCMNSLLAFGSNDAVIFGNQGTIQIDPMFWGTKGCNLTLRTGSGVSGTERFEYSKEGAGYVPMLRAVVSAIQEGKTEHPLRSHMETIAVATTMDVVLKSVLADQHPAERRSGIRGLST